MAKANYANLPINHSDTPIRLFKSDFLGTNRLRNNIKAYIGASVYF